MTIFIDVLKQLIKDDLSDAISDELRKSRAYGHNHKLSLEQKEALTILDTNLTRFDSTGNDKADAEEIVRLITLAKDSVQTIREGHKKPADGETMVCLNKIIFATQNFYKKLEDFSKLVLKEVSAKSDAIKDVAFVTLLNKVYLRTPEHIIYTQACYYFGQEIFHPESADLEIRGKKEAKLAVRLQTLSEVMKKDFTLEQQRSRALQVLKDLAADNGEVTKRMTSGPALPGLSIFGLQLTSASEWFSASKGRFDELFKLAVNKIKALTPETSDCPKPKVKATVKTEEHFEEEDEHDEEHDGVHSERVSSLTNQ